MILCKAQHQKAIDRAVFPGLQGGPHNHTTAGIAVAAKEASAASFKTYAAQIVENAKALAEGLLSHDFSLVTGGTDNHLVLVDLTNKNVPGRAAAAALNRAGVVCNSNSVPFDPRKPFDPSGIRMGTAAVTSRNLGPKEMQQVADWMNQVVSAPEDEALIKKVAAEVRELLSSFPAPGLPVS
jgi:glycine hydroxymethyltransferase